MFYKEYEIKSNGLEKHTEETSAVSLISYDIENANNDILTDSKKKEQIKKLKKSKDFPSNLEFIKSHTDTWNGTTASAFRNTDTGKVIIGMTGTNLQTNALEDIGADINIASYAVADDDPHFKRTQDFIKDLKKDYDIETITGHSLGGRDAMILGMSNNIENIVTYNTAPLTVKNTRPIFHKYMGFNEEKNDDKINKLIKNYNGKITHFISDNDELDWWVKQTDYVLPGEEVLISNGENHFMSGFFGKYEQSIITNKLKKPNKFESAMKKSFKKNSNYTKNKLNEINDIKSVMIMQNGGGALSSSQQKLLEYVTALAIVKGLSQQLLDDINQLNKLYDEMKEIFKKNWDDALESGHIIGKNLSSQEVLNALKAGDAYEDKMVTTPIDKINEKVKKLNATAAQYSDFITKVEDSIDEIINNDQMLANQIGGLL
ncbi:hypothetical protein [Staphylococcus agnetis]|uniref:hypothetical protein n=1 Tax=Staphylococcus agnetis TaxID=985762 RepID=UPI0039EC55D6